MYIMENTGIIGHIEEYREDSEAISPEAVRLLVISLQECKQVEDCREAEYIHSI